MNQPITGYPELDATEIECINKLKDTGAALSSMIEALKNDGFDKRWIAIGETHLQQGMMALVRAIARPEGF